MDELLRALKYRAWHRGTREADMMIGGFFDAHHGSWNAGQRQRRTGLEDAVQWVAHLAVLMKSSLRKESIIGP